ncbi:CorA family divalent cation transporter [Kaistella polysaccharea]|uniref:CorA family divalent cation transporter n=1 Tax=Kaistella polysaccharea TaxID=2878534 RepID=UPI001CF331E7|nr:CorA family divalent cation transporter [Kaistella polysaccharea]
MPIEILFKNTNCEWIDVESPTEDDLAYLHERYQINTLLLEDTIDANHLPKFEQDGNINFFLMRENTQSERFNLNTISDVSTKLGIFLMDKVIITIHRLNNRSIYEFKKEILLPQNEDITRDRIALNLALKVLKSYDDESKNLMEIMDQIESEIFLKTTNHSNHIRRLYRLKRKSGLNSRILNISTVWVEKFKMLDLDDSPVTDLKDKHKDVIGDFDHLNVQVASLISMFLAMSDQKANQVMKVLAIYSMYFFPITFIAGIYGMNFHFMPELSLKYGYYITLGIMGIISLITFVYVRKKGW